MSFDRRRVAINAIAAMSQALISALVLFALYRFLIVKLGIERLGLWSVLLATASVARLAEFGLGASVTRFVAVALTDHDGKREGAAVLETAVISIAAGAGTLMLLAYPLLKRLIGIAIPAPHVAEAWSILPLAVLSFWITSVLAAVLSAIDGCQRVDLRSGLMTIGSLAFLGFAVVLVPRHGLSGLAWALVGQNLLLVTMGWIGLRRMLPELSRFPCHWNRRHFRRMLGYGAQVQVASIATLMYEPVTKGLMSYYGGLGMVGYFEMANQLVTKARGLLLSALQALVPVVASMENADPRERRNLYLESYDIFLYVALPSFALLLAFMPFICDLWVGSYRTEFVWAGAALSCAWLINSVNAPAYFSYLGSGRLRWNTLSHVIIAILNASLGAGLGAWLGGWGVVAGWVAALSVGSIMVIFAYHREAGLDWTTILPSEHYWLAVAALATWATGNLLYEPLRSAFPGPEAALLLLPICLGLLLYPVLHHPSRIKLRAWFGHDIADGRAQ